MRTKIIILLAAVLAAGCADNNRKAEQIQALPFPDVVPPAMIDNQQDMLNYMAMNMWNGITDPSRTYHCDSLHISGVKKDDVEKKTADEIQQFIQEQFQIDNFAWQRDNKVSIDVPFRADGLHRILYKCPHCGEENQMEGKGIHLTCHACNTQWTMDEYGQLAAKDADTVYPHIPDWYRWQRECVRKELLMGTYKFEDNVHIYSLPGVEFIDLGEGRVTHDLENGFILCGHYNGHDYRIQRTSKSLYTLHNEFLYKKLGKVDAFDVSVKDDSFYCVPSKKDVVMKLMFATEEAYKILKEKPNI